MFAPYAPAQPALSPPARSMPSSSSDDPFTVAEDDYFKPSLDPLTSSSPLTSPPSTPLATPSLSMSTSSVLSASSSSRLSTSTRNLTPAKALDLLNRTVQVLRLSADIRVVEHSIRTIRHLYTVRLISLSHVVSDSILDPICHIIKHHSSNASLMEEACRLLARLWERSKEARLMLPLVLAVQILQAILETHFELYPSTIDAAIKALSELCREGSVVRKAMREERTLEWIMVCVRQWRDAITVQNSALQCVERAILREGESRRIAVALGVIEEVADLMQRFKDDCVIQYRCLKLQNTLIDGNAEWTMMSVSESYIESVIGDLRKFPHKLEVVSMGAKATQLLCMYDYSLDLFVKQGGVEALLGAFQRMVFREEEVGSSNHRRATFNCLAALEQLSLEPMTHALLFQIEPISCIEWIVSHYKREACVCEYASSVLRTLTHEANERALKGILFLRPKPKFTILEHVFRTATMILAAQAENELVAKNVCNLLLEECRKGRTVAVKRACVDLAKVVREVVEKQPAEDDIVNAAVSLAMKIR